MLLNERLFEDIGDIDKSLTYKEKFDYIKNYPTYKGCFTRPCKSYNLGLTDKQEETFYKFLEQEGLGNFWAENADLSHDIFQDGRMGGHLVLSTDTLDPADWDNRVSTKDVYDDVRKEYSYWDDEPLSDDEEDQVRQETCYEIDRAYNLLKDFDQRVDKLIEILKETLDRYSDPDSLNEKIINETKRPLEELVYDELSMIKVNDPVDKVLKHPEVYANPAQPGFKLELSDKKGLEDAVNIAKKHKLKYKIRNMPTYIEFSVDLPDSDFEDYKLIEAIDEKTVSELAKKHDIKLTHLDPRTFKIWTAGKKEDLDKFYSEYIELLKKENITLTEGYSDRYTPYNPELGWTEEDIALHKAIDWKKRNYEEYEILDDEFKGKVTVIGTELPENKLYTFHKFLRPNPVFPPYYRPVDFEAEKSLIGPMYNGTKHDTYDVHDRYETQSVYDMMSESLNEDLSKPEQEEFAFSTLVNSLIKDELEAIDGYNSAIVTFEVEGKGEFTDVLRDIISEENKHIGQLQSILERINPKTTTDIEEGQKEGQEQIEDTQAATEGENEETKVTLDTEEGVAKHWKLDKVEPMEEEIK